MLWEQIHGLIKFQSTPPAEARGDLTVECNDTLS